MKLISNNLSLKKIGAGVGIGVVFGAFTRAAGLFALIGLISLATPYLLPKDQEVILLIFLSQISSNTKKGIKPIKCSPLFRGYTDSPYSGNLQKLSECRDLVISSPAGLRRRGVKTYHLLWELNFLVLNLLV
jgi:hypothetical protein